LLAQELAESPLSDRKVRRAQALPNFFIVGAGAGIVAPEFMTDQVLNLCFCPRLLGSDSPAVCNGFASFCNSPVENDREKRELILFVGADFT
jgi:hypothetical protein